MERQNKKNILPSSIDDKKQPLIKILLSVLALIVLVALLLPEPQRSSSTSSQDQCSDSLFTKNSIVESYIPIDKTEDTEQPISAAITYRNQDFYTFNFQTQRHELNLFLNDDKGTLYKRFQKIIDRLKTDQQEPLLITNGGIFNPDFTPTGLFVSNNLEISPLNSEEGHGNFYLKPNGIFFQDINNEVGILSTDSFHLATQEFKHALQSGPILIENGKVHPAFNEGSANLFIRSGVGVIDEKNAVFAISKEPVNFYDFALFFRDILQSQNALYLDGAISKFYVPSLLKYDTIGDFASIIAITSQEK